MTDKITIERENFELWWESFKDEHDEWRFADRDAILFAAWQAALAARQAEPVAYWIPSSEQFCFAKGGKPFARAWEPLYAAQPAPATPKGGAA